MRICRYEKAQKPLSSYEADINEFLNKQDEVAHEETTANVKFLFIDCGPLKQALSNHCDLWRTKLTGLLNKQAAAELRALHDTFRCAQRFGVCTSASFGRGCCFSRF